MERFVPVVALVLPIVVLVQLLQLFHEARTDRIQESSSALLSSDKVRWFDVQGRSLSQLVDSFRARAPRDHTGGACYGTTEWNVESRRLRVRVRSSGERSLRLALDVFMTLPRWSEYTEADVHLQKDWDRFFHALVRHELGHVRLALRAKSRLRKTLLRSRYFSARQNKNLLREIASDLMQKDLEYDRRSFSGASQQVFIRQAAHF